MDEKGLGQRLQAMRTRAGLTQQALCQRAGLSYSTLTKIERGAIKAPSIFTIQTIAATLGVSLDDLLGNARPGARPRRHSKSGVSFIYFDINGCLVRFFHAAFTHLAEQSGAPADVIETTFWHYNDEVCRGGMGLDDFNQVFAKALGLKKMDWQSAYMNAISPIEDMHKIVRWAAGVYQIGLLSNIMPGFVEVMRQRNLLPDIAYDVVVDSSEVKAIKPEAEIYKIATEKAARPAGEILLIDDTRTNLMAAEKCGWHVLWFDEYRASESAALIRSALDPAD